MTSREMHHGAAAMRRALYADEDDGAGPPQRPERGADARFVRGGVRAPVPPLSLCVRGARPAALPDRDLLAARPRLLRLPRTRTEVVAGAGRRHSRRSSA